MSPFVGADPGITLRLAQLGAMTILVVTSSRVSTTGEYAVFGRSRSLVRAAVQGPPSGMA
ncbi:MAG: hypothetical protein M0Z44_06250 [Gammaproteobacteria bacterium]|nr:hypothetical protein [Gammaproteobacteria bacterium]